MPNFYAHQVFGQLVWNQLPDAAKCVLPADDLGFRLGLFGPDPLFFYRPLVPTKTNREGHQLHREVPGLVLDRFRDAVARRTPFALGYAAGFFCHYLLDCACHPYVYQVTRGNSIRHVLLEGALDRLLWTEQTPRLIFALPRQDSVFEAAAIGYADAKPRQFALSTRRFLQVSRSLTAFRRITPTKRGRVPAAEVLRRQMMDAIPDAAAQIAQLMDALQSGQTLDFLPQLNFAGRDMAPAGALC